MNDKRGTIYVDFQSRAKEFAVGDKVFPRGAWPHYAGRLVALYPAIGMADVEFANGPKRFPVEDLEKAEEGSGDTHAPRIENNAIPGGRETVINKSARRVAAAYLKKALYWAARDRQYRSTKSERSDGNYYCPKHPDQLLQKAIYKRREGRSDRLLGCPTCMFLIKVDDILMDSLD
jgi:hypothetical protein